MTTLFSPAVALGVVLSISYAALFHFWQGGDIYALRRYLLAACLGFAAGHIAGQVIGIGWFRMGHLNVLSGTVGAVAALLIAKRLQA